MVPKRIRGDQTSLKPIHLKGLIYILKIMHLQTAFSLLISENPLFKSLRFIFPNKKKNKLLISLQLESLTCSDKAG